MSQPLTQLPAFRTLIILLLTGVGLLMTSLWLVDGSWFLASLVWGAVIGVALLPYPRVLVAVAIATAAAPIFLLRHNLVISNLATAGLLVTLILAYPRNRNLWHFNVVQFLLAVYCLNIVVIMFSRGFGLLVFGGEGAGAMSYVRILLAAVLVFGATWYPLRANTWRWVIFFLALGSAIPILADYTIAYGKFLNVIPRFIASSGMRPGEAYLEGIVDTYFLRFIGAKDAAIWFSVALIALAKPERLFGLGFVRYLPVLILIAVAATISGFRIAILTVVLIFALAAVIGKQVTLPRLGALGILGLLGFVFLYGFATELPLPVQRSISFLPWIEVSPVAKTHAVETIDWRIEVWKGALHEIPKHLLLGKGFTFNVAAFMYGQVSIYDWALLNSTYHSGPLSTLILSGLPGTFSLIGIQLALLIRHGRERGREWANPQLKSCHLAFYAYLITEMIIFWFVYGDIASSIPLLFRQAAVLEGLLATERLSRQPEPAPEPQPVLASAKPPPLPSDWRPLPA